jgi:hypothetical protein
VQARLLDLRVVDKRRHGGVVVSELSVESEEMPHALYFVSPSRRSVGNQSPGRRFAVRARPKNIHEPRPLDHTARYTSNGSHSTLPLKTISRHGVHHNAFMYCKRCAFILWHLFTCNIYASIHQMTKMCRPMTTKYGQPCTFPRPLRM